MRHVGHVMRIGDGSGWSFLGAKWTDGPDGELWPPDHGGTENMAVPNDRDYSDFQARFRFKFLRQG